MLSWKKLFGRPTAEECKDESIAVKIYKVLEDGDIHPASELAKISWRFGGYLYHLRKAGVKFRKEEMYAENGRVMDGWQMISSPEGMFTKINGKTCICSKHPTILRLENKNVGKPKNPDIIISSEGWEDEKPRAVEQGGQWFYSYYGAKIEAEFRNKKIPSKKQWEQIIESGWMPEELTGFFENESGRRRENGFYSFYCCSERKRSQLYYAGFANGGGQLCNNGKFYDGYSLRLIQ